MKTLWTLLLVLAALALASSQRVVTSVELKALPAMPAPLSESVPLSFATGFARGDVPEGSDVRLVIDSNCETITSQFRCLRSWKSDNSCKHGHFAAALTPAQAGLASASTNSEGAPLVVHLLSYESEGSTTGPSYQDTIGRLQELSATASATIQEGATNYDVNLLLADETSVRITGPVMTEIVARGAPADISRNPHPQLKFEIVARVWHDANFVDFDLVFDNTKTLLTAGDNERYPNQNNTDHQYSVNIAVGGYTVDYTLNHFFGQRWRHQQMWPLTDSTSAVFLVVPNMKYLSYARLIPNYDYENRPEPTEQERDAAWSGFQASNRDPLEVGIIQGSMPSTGGRPDIGLLPEWTSRYIFAPYDYRLFDIMKFCSSAGGSFGIHISSNIEAEPKLTSFPQAYGRQVVNEFNDPFTADCAHQPSMHYVPYLLTADKFSADEMLYWSNYAMHKQNPGSDTSEYSSNRYRGWNRGYLIETTRGVAWCLRNIHHAVEILPLDAANDAGSRDLYETVVENNMQTWVDDMLPTQSFGFYGHGWLKMSDRYEPDCLNNTYSLVSPWQDDFFVLVVNSWISEPTDNFLAFATWLSNFVVGRFQERDDWDRSYGAPYRLAAEILDNTTNQPRLVESWAELWQYSFGGKYETQQDPYPWPAIDGEGNAGSINPSSCCYPFGARGACRLVKANVMAGDLEVTDDAEECARYLTENLSGNLPDFKDSFADVPPPCPVLESVCQATPTPCNNVPGGGDGSSAATLGWMK